VFFTCVCVCSVPVLVYVYWDFLIYGTWWCYYGLTSFGKIFACGLSVVVSSFTQLVCSESEQPWGCITQLQAKARYDHRVLFRFSFCLFRFEKPTNTKKHINFKNLYDLFHIRDFVNIFRCLCTFWTQAFRHHNTLEVMLFRIIRLVRVSFFWITVDSMNMYTNA